MILALPEFIQLMDDDIVSLIGLVWIANPSISDYDTCSFYLSITVSQLPLSLYLMTQCQMKLHHPVTSLAQTLVYVEVARRKPFANIYTLDQLLLELLNRKILLHITDS